MSLWDRLELTRRKVLSMREYSSVKGCSKRTISHFWSSMQREEYHQLWDREFIKRFSMLTSPKRKLTILQASLTSSTSGKRPLTTSSTATLFKCVTMINTSFSKTCLSSVYLPFSGIDKFLTRWRVSLMLQFCWQIVKTRSLVLFHHAEWSLAKSFRQCSPQFVLFQTRKRTAITYSGLSIASTFATWLLFRVVNRVL